MSNNNEVLQVQVIILDFDYKYKYAKKDVGGYTQQNFLKTNKERSYKNENERKHIIFFLKCTEITKNHHDYCIKHSFYIL